MNLTQLNDEIQLNIQQLNKATETSMADLSQKQSEAEKILENIRETSATKGVSQQADCFKKEYDSHIKQSNNWRLLTLLTLLLLVVVIIGTFYFGIIFFDKFQSTADIIHFTSSKILLIGIVSYMLFLFSKNFLSHKHNAIVNKHRHNALLTYQLLVDASNSPEGKEIILNKAASCIFSPQDTGYSKTGKNTPSGMDNSMFAVLPKLFNASQ